VTQHTKPVIGLCGGIGSGKSAVAREFERLGCLVVSSDRLNDEILGESAVVAAIRGRWGDEAAAGGRVNRQWLGRRVFSDAADREWLESLTHPLIAARRAAMILAGSADPAVKAIILDSPLLFEKRLDRLCDAVVFVEASDSERLKRVIRDRGWDPAELQLRERWQLSLDEKRRRADLLIPNDGTLEALAAGVSSALGTILEKHRTQPTSTPRPNA
jgi:dephospho-CoA kinase